MNGQFLQVKSLLKRHYDLCYPSNSFNFYYIRLQHLHVGPSCLNTKQYILKYSTVYNTFVCLDMHEIMFVYLTGQFVLQL